MKIQAWRWILLAATVGCAGAPEDTFTDDLTFDICTENYLVCSITAQCILDGDEYLQGSFPSTQRFIVTTQGEVDITVSILFASRGSSGVDTHIFWYEPNCLDREEWSSDGIDIFREAGEDGIIEQTARMTQFGNHMIEVSSDAFADYFIKTDVASP
jgi:hypothetical protein